MLLDETPAGGLSGSVGPGLGGHVVVGCRDWMWWWVHVATLGHHQIRKTTCLGWGWDDDAGMRS